MKKAYMLRAIRDFDLYQRRLHIVFRNQQLNKSVKLWTACHEAGHVIAGYYALGFLPEEALLDMIDSQILSLKQKFDLLRPPADMLSRGGVLWPRFPNQTKELLFANMVQFAGGMTAQRIEFEDMFPEDTLQMLINSGGDGDIERIAYLAANIVGRRSETFKLEVEELHYEACDQAEEIILAHRSELRAVTRALYVHERLDKNDLSGLLPSLVPGAGVPVFNA